MNYKILSEDYLIKFSEKANFNIRNEIYPETTAYNKLVTVNKLDFFHRSEFSTKNENTNDFFSRKNIEYNLTFSVSKKRKKDFLDYLEDDFKNPTKIKINGNNEIHVFNFLEKNNLNLDIKEKKIKIKNTEYITYSYNAKGNLLEIMCYFNYIESIIKLIGKLWGYDDSGEEISLLDFKESDIVNLNDDKSKNYLVLDFGHSFKENGNIQIHYNIVEIKTSNINEVVIIHGDLITATPDRLKLSRSEKLNILLN